jgi:hypothetical protein
MKPQRLLGFDSAYATEFAAPMADSVSSPAAAKLTGDGLGGRIPVLA